MAKKKKLVIHKGHLPRMFQYLVHLHKVDPDCFSDADYLQTVVFRNLSDIKDIPQDRCKNCEASMKIYEYKVDFLNALLVKKMGDIVSSRLKQGIDFTKANSIHVVSSDMPDSVRHRTTTCSKLGLVAMGKEQGHWVITKRGFEALAGKKIPEMVKVFRNKIVEKSEEETTLQEVFNKSNSEYKSHAQGYDISEWVRVAGIHTGNLF